MVSRYPKRVDGFRSGLEAEIAKQLTEDGTEFTYEQRVVTYQKPERASRYTPDFELKNGILIEGKGRFTVEDRAKHLLIKQQRPDLDIRFVFTRSSSPIRKGSKTTYAKWCEKHGFLYADKQIPEAWLREGNKDARS